MRFRVFVFGVFLLCSFLIGCERPQEVTENISYERFDAEFIGTFDVKTQIIGYAESEEEFMEKASVIFDKMHELHKLYDIYHDYEGIANIKTINDRAGIEPVEVDSQIIDLILLSKEAYVITGGLTNIAMGSVLRIWHDYRMRGIDFPEDAELPSDEELTAAALHTKIEDVIVDVEKNTVFLADPEMSLDVGAVAKGYAAEVAKDLAVAAGFQSGILDAGGNALTIGVPKGESDRWAIGIQDPFQKVDGVRNLVDVIYLNDKAIVSSGGYSRYYEVDGRAYNHIIDPRTLFPPDHFAAVTVVHENSAVAEYLSTAVFILSHEQGLSLVEENGAEALWIYRDGELKATDAYQRISREFGNYSAID